MAATEKESTAAQDSAEAAHLSSGINNTETNNTDKQVDLSTGDSQNETESSSPQSPISLPSGSSLSSDKDAAVDDKAPAAATAAISKTETTASHRSAGRTAIIVFSLAMALFLGALDNTIVTTALPTIATHFNATSAAYTWVGSSYLLASASSAPLWGKLSDIWGRKPVLLLANGIFLLGSLLAGLANSIGMLIVARAIQGIGGGGLIVLVYICIGDLFSMRERPKWYGILGTVWAFASGVGPVIGGIFTEKVTWRWCFYINLPLDGLSLILLFLFLQLSTPKTPFLEGIKAVDWLGVLAVVGGVVMFLFGLESGGVTHPWTSAFTLCLIIFGVVTLVLFFINEWKFAKYPIIPVRIFKHTSNLAALGVGFFHGVVFIGEGYYLPLYFQVVLEASPIMSGVYLFALVMVISLSSFLSGFFMRTTGRYRPPIWVGLVFMTLGTGLFIDLPDHKEWSKIIIYQMIAGFGTGPNFQAPLIALQSNIKGHDIAVGTATFSFVRNLSTSISVVIGGVVFQNQLKKHAATLIEALGPELGHRLSASGFGTTSSQLKSLTLEQRHTVSSVYTDSLQKLWIFYTAFCVAGIVVSLFIKKKELSREHETTKTGLQEQERVRQEEIANRKAQKRAKNDPEKGINDDATPAPPNSHG